ncbi:MAG TPA: hypothetical protein VGF97_11150 [Rhizomicrobium sp.]
MRMRFLHLACLLVLAGCDQNHHDQSKDAKTVTIEGANGTVTISGNGTHYAVKSSHGSETVEISSNGAVPSLPGFVPVYPGAKVVSSVVGAGGNGKGGTFVIEAGAPVDAVIGFYKGKMKSQGFSETMSLQSGASTMFSSGSGKKSIEVVASASEGGTRAQIVWSGGH